MNQSIAGEPDAAPEAAPQSAAIADTAARPKPAARPARRASKGLTITAALNIGIVLALAAIALFVVTERLESVLHDGVETYGTRMVGGPVTLEGVNIAELTGTIELTGLSVGNPAGFRSERALWLDRITVEVDLHTLTSDPVVIRRIAIEGLRITYESGGKDSNLDAIGNNIEAYIESDRPKGAAPDGANGPDESDSDDGPRLIVEDLVIPGAELLIHSRLLLGANIPSDVADIQITGLGHESGGVTAGELAEAIINELTVGVGRAASPDLTGDGPGGV